MMAKEWLLLAVAGQAAATSRLVSRHTEAIESLSAACLTSNFHYELYRKISSGSEFKM